MGNRSSGALEYFQFGLEAAVGAVIPVRAVRMFSGRSTLILYLTVFQKSGDILCDRLVSVCGGMTGVTATRVYEIVLLPIHP